MREALEGLWPENAEAWRLFQQTVTRFAADLQLTSAVLARLVPDGEMDAETFGELLERLSVIYEWLYPPVAKTADAT